MKNCRRFYKIHYLSITGKNIGYSSWQVIILIANQRELLVRRRMQVNSFKRGIYLSRIMSRLKIWAGKRAFGNFLQRNVVNHEKVLKLMMCTQNSQTPAKRGFES